MSRPIHIFAEAFAAALFAISVLMTGLRTVAPWGRLYTEGVSFDPRRGNIAMSGNGGLGGPNLLGVIAQPSNPVLWALLIAVMLAALLHLASRLRNHRAAPLPVSHTLGLIVASAWPWVLNPAPMAGLAMALISCALLVHGITRSPTPDRPAAHMAAAFIAGWLVIAGTSALGMVLYRQAGLGLERSVLLGLLLAALVGAWVQLRIESYATFSLAIIWAMIGFAAASAGGSITIATACVLGISALAVVIVRVTT